MRTHRNMELIRDAFNDEMHKLAFVPAVAGLAAKAAPFLKGLLPQLGTQLVADGIGSAVSKMGDNPKPANSITGPG